MGLARGTFHSPRGHGKEDAPSINGACVTTRSRSSADRERCAGEFTHVLSFVCCAQFGERWWYRHACAVGGVFNVLMMMGANLVGFVVGMDGVQYLGYQLVNSWSGGFLPPDFPSCLL